MAIIKNSSANKGCTDVGKGDWFNIVNRNGSKLSHFGNPPGISQLERQLDIEPLNDPAVPFQGISPKSSVSHH